MENITDTAFHGGKAKHLEYYFNLMEKSVLDGRITERDRNQIQAFISEIKACGTLSSQRAYKISYQLVGLRKYLPEYSKADTSAVFSGLEKLKAESGYTEITQSDVIKLCKRFLLWLHESGEASEGLKPEKLMKIKAKTMTVTKTAEDILSPEQMEDMFRSVSNTRNRAMIELLYESLGRAGEIATIKWGQIEFRQTYASVRLDGKTGKTRTVPIYSSHIALRRWRDQYPGDASGDHLIFPARDGSNNPMSYNGMAKIIKSAAKKAGIEKPITLHTFRHSRITHLLQAGMNESTIKLLAWGDVGSNMLKVYSHLTPGDVEKAFSQMYGLKPIEEFSGMDPAVSPRQCQVCGMLNPATNLFCGGCGQGLTAAAADSQTKTMTSLDAIMATPQGKELLNHVVQEMAERRALKG